MPIFEFVCKKCGKKFETLLLNSADKAQCPQCKSEEVQKQLSIFSASSSSSCLKYDSCQPASKHKCTGGCCCR